MNPQTYIFFGPSGAGKGTQAKLLIDKLKEKDSREVLYIETGQKFREFSTEASFTAKRAKEVMSSGGLLPEFLPIWIWTESLIKHVSGDEHMILDGLSRRVHEAPILDSAMKFYKRESPIILALDVTREWAKDKMMGRGRMDDNENEVEKRIAWYYENVLPAMEFFKNDPYYRFISINGEQTIEDVHKEILEKIGL